MKMFGFTGLKTLHDDMKKKREEREQYFHLSSREKILVAFS